MLLITNARWDCISLCDGLLLSSTSKSNADIIPPSLLGNNKQLGKITFLIVHLIDARPGNSEYWIGSELYWICKEPNTMTEAWFWQAVLQGFPLQKIAKYAANREFTDLMVFNEDRKSINGLLLIHLPDGPTAHFKLSNLVLSKDIRVEPSQ